MDKHVLERMQNIMDNLSNANLTDVTELLNYYNGDAVMINGTSYHPFNDPSTAVRLNARYHELTGQDHPRFVEQAPIVIDGLMKDKDMLLQAGTYTPMYFDKLEQIKGNITKENKGIEITESHHPLQDFHDVLGRLDSASVEEVTQQLDYYNGDAVMINGTSYHPFNDPSTAVRLNARYHELTGQDHPRFVEQAPIVIDGLMKDKDMLLQAGTYTPMYFDKLEQIKGNIASQPSLEENKKTFMEARDKQRQIDNVTRSQQIEAMNNTIQQSNEITQNFEASMDNNSMGGMSR